LKVLAVIPARWSSSRFPGKHLAIINGEPMINLVWKQVMKTKSINNSIVATDDKRIFDSCKKMSINAIMTSKKHLTGTDRVYEVSKKVKSDIYVNIQGDEPLIRNIGFDGSGIHCNYTNAFTVDNYDKYLVKVVLKIKPLNKNL